MRRAVLNLNINDLCSRLITTICYSQ